MPNDQLETKTARRDFLGRTALTVIGVGAVGGLVGAVRFALPDGSEGQPSLFTVGAQADFKTSTFTWIRDKNLFVLREPNGFAAFSSRCTHLGCTVARTSSGFQCPCHGAAYDHEGKVLKGPATADLPWYEVWLGVDGRVWVNCKNQVPVGTFSSEAR